MPLSPLQLKVLTESQSAYGCGLNTCKRCYPVQYACDYCNTELPEPIANGENYTCEECGYDNKENN